MRSEYHILFPFQKIPKGSKIVLYGAGDVGQTFYWQARSTGYCEVVGWLDRNWENARTPYPLIQKKKLRDMAFDYLVIAIKSLEIASEVRDGFAREGVDASKIILATDCVAEYTLCELGGSDIAPFWQRLSTKIGAKMPEDAEEELRDEESLADGHLSAQNTVQIGLLTTGYMADTMAQMVRRRLPNAELAAVAARDLKKAEIFAERHGIGRAYGSYGGLMCDSGVELIHVASPAALHHEHVMQCLAHGKHVLCEKPFALNEAQAREMFSLAEERGLLLADGLWTRYLPMARKIKEICRSDRIGRIFAVNANCYYPSIHSNRINNHALGGGVLLENGLYLLSFVSLVFGPEPDKIEATAIVNEKGVDIQDEVILHYGDRIATLNFGIRGISDRRGYIYGEKGYIEVIEAHEYRKVTVYGAKGEILDTFEMDPGYQYEMIACIQALAEGRIVLEEYPKEETLAILRIADEIRRQVGVRYECEK